MARPRDTRRRARTRDATTVQWQPHQRANSESHGDRAASLASVDGRTAPACRPENRIRPSYSVLILATLVGRGSARLNDTDGNLAHMFVEGMHDHEDGLTRPSNCNPPL